MSDKKQSKAYIYLIAFSLVLSTVGLVVEVSGGFELAILLWLSAIVVAFIGVRKWPRENDPTR